MNEREKGMNPAEKSVEEKKPYETPRLTEYGRIADLTRGDGAQVIADVLLSSLI